MCAQKFCGLLQRDWPTIQLQQKEREEYKERWGGEKSNHMPRIVNQEDEAVAQTDICCVCGECERDREPLTHPWEPNWNQTRWLLQKRRGKFRHGRFLWQRSEVNSQKTNTRKRNAVMETSQKCVFFVRNRFSSSPRSPTRIATKIHERGHCPVCVCVFVEVKTS